MNRSDSFERWRRAATTVFLVLAWPRLPAQTLVPTGSPVELTRIPVDSSLFAADTSRTAADIPVVTRTTRWRVLVGFGRWASDAQVSTRLSAGLAGCGPRLGLTSDESAELATTNVWSAFDSATAGRPLLLVSVVPHAASVHPCGDSLLGQAHSVLRGVRLPSPSSVYFPTNDPANASLLVNGRPIRPAFLGRLRQPAIARGLPRDAASQLRLYVPLDELAPSSSGDLPSVRVVITTADSTFVDTVAVPAATVRLAWHSSIAWRIARIRDMETQPRLTLQRPTGSALRPSHDAYVANQLRDAAWYARNELRATDAGDRRFAQVVASEALLSAGDSAAARLLLREVTNAEPCISIDGAVDAGFRRALSPMRPKARCETLSPSRVFLKGLVLPGNAQLATGRRVFAAPFALLTTLTAAYAALEFQGSKSDYAQYGQATSTQDATRLFQSAERRQGTARTFAVSAAAIWLAGAIEGVIVESRHTRRMQRVRGYGAR